MSKVGFDVDLVDATQGLPPRHRPTNPTERAALKAILQSDQNARHSIEILSHTRPGQSINWASPEIARTVGHTNVFLETLRLHSAGDEAGQRVVDYAVRDGFTARHPAIAGATLNIIDQMGEELRETAAINPKNETFSDLKRAFDSQIEQAKKLMLEVARSAVYLDAAPGVPGAGERARLGQKLAQIQNAFVDTIVRDLPGISATHISQQFDELEDAAYEATPTAQQEVQMGRQTAINRLDGGVDPRFFDPPAQMTRHRARELAEDEAAAPEKGGHERRRLTGPRP